MPGCPLYFRGTCPKSDKDCSLSHPTGWEGLALKKKGDKGGKGSWKSSGKGDPKGGKGKRNQQEPPRGRSPTPRNTNTPRNGTPRSQLPVPKKEVPCKSYFQGNCSMGDSCEWSHDKKHKGTAKGGKGGKGKSGKGLAATATDTDDGNAARRNSPSPAAPKAKAKADPKKPGKKGRKKGAKETP